MPKKRRVADAGPGSVSSDADFFALAQRPRPTRVLGSKIVRFIERNIRKADIAGLDGSPRTHCLTRFGDPMQTLVGVLCALEELRVIGRFPSIAPETEHRTAVMSAM